MRIRRMTQRLSTSLVFALGSGFPVVEGLAAGPYPAQVQVLNLWLKRHLFVSDLPEQEPDRETSQADCARPG